MAARDISGAELSAFREHGWTRLEGLVSPADAATLLVKAYDLVARGEQVRASGAAAPDDFWFSWSNSVFEARHMGEGPFVELAKSKAMGQLASQLIQAARPQGGRCPVRSLGGNLFCKLGGGSPWGREIPFHQDGPSFHVTQPGFVTIWIALDDVGADQGGMHFLDSSHCLGALEAHHTGFPLQRRPELLDQYELTPSQLYAAGDATAHDGFMLHGSPENLTNRPRWGYACLYVAGDLDSGSITSAHIRNGGCSLCIRLG